MHTQWVNERRNKLLLISHLQLSLPVIFLLFFYFEKCWFNILYSILMYALCRLSLSHILFASVVSLYPNDCFENWKEREKKTLWCKFYGEQRWIANFPFSSSFTLLLLRHDNATSSLSTPHIIHSTIKMIFLLLFLPCFTSFIAFCCFAAS